MNQEGAETKILQKAYKEWLDDLLEPSTKSKRSLKRLQKPHIRKTASELILKQRSILSVSKTYTRKNPEKAAKQELRNAKSLQRVSYSNWTYPSNMNPGIDFFKWLRIPDAFESVHLHVPPTLLVVPSSTTTSPTFLWIDGSNISKFQFQIYGTKESLKRKMGHIVSRLSRHVIVKASPHAELQRMDESRLVHEWINALLEDDNPQCSMIQKFIQCKGKHAWITRVEYKRKHPSTVWILSGKDSSTMNLTLNAQSSIVKSNNLNSWSQPRKMIEAIVPALEQMHQIYFSDFVADLILDSCGQWWFIQVYGFQCQRYPLKNCNPLHVGHSTAVLNPSVFQISQQKMSTTALKCPGRYCHIESDDRFSAPLEKIFFSFKDLFLCHHAQQYEEGNSTLLAHMNFADSLSDFWSSMSRKDRNRIYNRVSVCANCTVEYSRRRTGAEGRLQEKPEVKRSSKNEPIDLPEKEVPASALEEELSGLEALLASVHILSKPTSKVALDTPSIPDQNNELQSVPFFDEHATTWESPQSETPALNTEKETPVISNPLDKHRMEEQQEAEEYTSKLRAKLLDSLKTPSFDISQYSASKIWDTYKLPQPACLTPLKPQLDIKNVHMQQFIPTTIVLIDSCQSIFFHDAYKESLLLKAQKALDMCHKVEFRIPATDTTMDFSAQTMVLRTLHLELRSVIATTSYSLPEIIQDIKGNTVMIIAPQVSSKTP